MTQQNGQIRNRVRVSMYVTILVAFLPILLVDATQAQDVPGIEICTVEKTMERRTSCLQSNVDFLKKTMTKQALDYQKKLDAAGRDVEAFKGQVEALRSAVSGLQKSIEQLQTQSTGNKPKDGPAK